MTATLHLDIVSPEEQIFSGEAEFVALPGEVGELGIYPRHAPLITRVKPGEVRVKLAGGDELSVFIAGGIIEVQPALVTVLADTAIRAKDIDEAKVLEARKRASDALAKARGRAQIAAGEAELALLTAQLATIRKYRKK